MSNTDKLKEALLDKGYPSQEVFRIMKMYLLYFGEFILLPDPSIYTTKDSIDRYYKHTRDVDEKLAEELIFKIQFWKPVWNRYKNWEYDL